MQRKRSRYILKYDHHHDDGSGRYGVYDNAERTVAWCKTQAEATSRQSRLNAVENLHADLQAAINNVGTILTGTLSEGRRGRYKALRETIRALLAALPDVETLTAEAAQEVQP